MHLPAYRTALRGVSTETAHLSFQFGSALGTASGSCLEQRLEIRTINPLGTCAEALLSISAPEGAFRHTLKGWRSEKFPVEWLHTGQADQSTVCAFRSVKHVLEHAMGG